MPITYPYRNNLFAYATGFVGMEGGNARDGAAAVPLGVSGPGDGAEGGGNTRPARAPRCHFELPPVSWTSKLKSREWEAFRVCGSAVEA